jgi:PhnB protein
MTIQPYLFFGGRCEEALDFYRGAVGAEVVELMRFRDSPAPPPPEMMTPDWTDKIMHCTVRIGESDVMASDGCPSGDAAFRGFSLSISVADAPAAHHAFEALSEGGSVQMPLGETFWSPCFGMVTDRYGLQWMVNVPAETS